MMFGIDVDVNVVGADVDVATESTTAVVGAVQEAITNAAKHAAPQRIVAFAEVDDDGIGVASVRDDGCGFDPSAVADGHGIGDSIRSRIDERGGRVEVISAPGRGTEVRLWMPG